MIVDQNMMAETEIICQQSIIDVQYHLRVTKDQNLKVDVVSAAAAAASAAADPSSPIFESITTTTTTTATATEISSFQSVVCCSETIKEVAVDSSSVNNFPRVRSGGYAEIGSRSTMDDEHIRVDDLSVHLGSFFKWPSAFYAVFDGHNGPDAAAYIKRNSMRLFFEDVDLPQTSEIDAFYLEALVNSHRRAFLRADNALAGESGVKSACGTTALTALVLGRHLLVANAGDSRAVLCRNGTAVDMSEDHRPTCESERRRVEGLGLGYCIEGEYLNGLGVTRSLGDWELKLPFGSGSPLIAEPDVQRVLLTEDDEFLIIGCDGIWDVMSSQCAVSLVRRALRRHDDPELCAKELVLEASRLHSGDNLTVVVVCFRAPKSVESCPPQRRRFRCFKISEETRNRLKSLLEGN